MRSIVILVSALIITSATQVFAAAAESYKCLGVNRADRSAVEFEVAFDTYTAEVGFTNQSITITATNGIQSFRPVVLQMFGANANNKCQSNEFGEIYMNEQTSRFSMSQPPNEDQDGRVTTFKFGCGALKLDVVAVCQFSF